MPIAITGATGFVGSHLLERLAGSEVSCLARAPSEALTRTGCRIVRGALDHPAALDALVAGADIVFHVAGAIAARSDAEFMAVNRDGTAAVAQACVRAGVTRLVHVSTLAVTGPAARDRPVDESTTPHPVTAYGRSKLAGEEAVRASGVDFTIVRPPIVYGPRDRQTLRLFRFARGRMAPLLGDGLQELSLVHVTDLACALLAAATSPGTVGRVYHVAHPAIVTQRALMAEIARAVGSRPTLVPLPAAVVRTALVVSGLLARVAGRRTLLDPGKAAELLAPAWTCATDALERDAGWRAQMPLARGAREAADWYRQAGWL